MSITVYWIQDGTEHHENLDEPFMAAVIMAAAEVYDNLTPAGWSWGSEQGYEEVMSLRDGRPYTEEPTERSSMQREAGRPDRGPWVWIARWRIGYYYHDVADDLHSTSTTCERVTNTDAGEFQCLSAVQDHGMKPCPGCYTNETEPA